MKIRERLRESDFSKGKTTIYTIASESGVSAATVSRIINNSFHGTDEVRLRVQALVEKHRYHPSAVAKRLSGKKVASRMVGVMAPFFIHPFFVEVLKGIYSVFHEEGYHIILYDIDSKLMKKKMFATIIEEELLDGLLLVNMHLNEEEHAALSKTAPVVLAAAETEFADSMIVNNAKGIEIGMQYLFELGHRHIAFINNEKGILESRVREKAFREKMGTLAVALQNRLSRRRPKVRLSRCQEHRGEQPRDHLPPLLQRPDGLRRIGLPQRKPPREANFNHGFRWIRDDLPQPADDRRPADGRDGRRGRAAAHREDQREQCRPPAYRPGPLGVQRADLLPGNGRNGLAAARRRSRGRFMQRRISPR